MKARLISQTPKGTIKSGKLDIETALKMQTYLIKNAPNDVHKILIT